MPVFQRKRSILFPVVMLALLGSVIAFSFFLVSQQAAVEARVKNALDDQLRLTRVVLIGAGRGDCSARLSADGQGKLS